MDKQLFRIMDAKERLLKLSNYKDENVYKWLELAGGKKGDLEKVELCKKLILEEIDELFIALEDNDLEEVKDAFVDIRWVTLNLTYFLGISLDELNDYARKIEISNYSKFCKNEQEALDTIYNYENGTHWDKMGEEIDCYFEKQGDFYIVKRRDNGKIMKSINYKSVRSL